MESVEIMPLNRIKAHFQQSMEQQRKTLTQPNCTDAILILLFFCFFLFVAFVCFLCFSLFSVVRAPLYQVSGDDGSRICR